MEHPLNRRGVTLIEVLVAAGLFSLILTAILSFYIEASAVSAKRDQQSERLRRFHLGLDKMEQELREGRVIQVGSRNITFLALQHDFPEVNGFPNFERLPAQFLVSKEGVIRLQGDKEKNILPFKTDETVYFGWVNHAPQENAEIAIQGDEEQLLTLRLSMILYGEGKRSTLLFTRNMSLLRY